MSSSKNNNVKGQTSTINQYLLLQLILIFHNKVYHVLCESPEKLVKLLQSFLDLMPQRIIEKKTELEVSLCSLRVPLTPPRKQNAALLEDD